MLAMAGDGEQDCGYLYFRDVNRHIERKSQNTAANVNEVNLSKTEKGRGFGSYPGDTG